MSHLSIPLAAVITVALAALTPSVLVADDLPYAGKRILHVDSYHRGNEWNDRIADAVRDTLDGTGVDLKIVHMDTKRKPSEEQKIQATRDVMAVIDDFSPDVVTASDDNASKYLIADHYKDADLPFVFCGLNWDASTYGFPFENVTGMVEVSPIPQILKLLRGYAAGDRVGYLTEDTETKRKELEYHERLFGFTYDETYFVSTFEDWKEAYVRAQDEVDMLVILGVGALTDFNEDEARKLAETSSKIPSGTDFSWLMPFTMLGIGKVPEEQGRWAAKAALRILDGTAPSQIPIAYNKDGQLYFNKAIAERVGVTEIPPLAQLVD